MWMGGVGEKEPYSDGVRGQEIVAGAGRILDSGHISVL